MTSNGSGVGFVVIGRNEGPRLVACLGSIGRDAGPTVYVDSGSSDGSQQMARDAGVDVVDLDRDVPFTAARARNAGNARLLETHSDIVFVQFIDGDCALDRNWITSALNLLDARPEVALVCGRRRERYPDASLFNAMCDAEWDGPIGQILESGGDFLVRTAAFSEVGGFRAGLIAGEEPELCLRLRERGWQIWRLPVEMTLHDANITRVSQWWRRAVRAGHAFAEVSWLHRASPQRIWQRNVIRSLFWAAIAPFALLAAFVTPWALLLLLAYPLNLLRQAGRGEGGWPDRLVGAFFNVLGKFPEAQGIVTYHLHRMAGRKSGLIEYK